MKPEHSWSLGALCLAVAVLCSPIMSSAADFGVSLGEIYLSTDALTHEDALVDQPINVPFEFYLAAAIDYESIGQTGVNGLNGIWAWEAAVEIPAAITIIAPHLQPGSINVGNGANNFIVGGTELLAAGLDPIILVRFEAILLTAVQDEVLTIAPSTPTTFDDAGSLELGPGWLEYMPLGDCDYVSRRPGSGCLRAFAEWGSRLVMNCVDEPECVETATKHDSWGTVKSRYTVD